ncbi:Rubrerythrin [uncultured Desulfobacterium sp.]|uniref:Rubrerythrin n=1 Tax=uncultured Desulfobacterium sp. TaxID=201089 RepID=A0A445N2E2_9BACT|nr:Rubrerythrin [uncultured Desulfobacterium sp.]
MKTEEYNKIISFAVEKEIESYDFYQGVCDKTADSNLKAIFRELADEEKKHRHLLEGLLSRPKDFHFNESADYKVSETVDRPKLSLTMKPADAIGLAMKNEEDAMRLYAELANASSDSEQKEMFLSLSRMEQGHKTKLEDLYTNMAFPEVW